MLDMILSAIGGWKIKLLAAGLAVAVVGGYVLWLRADAADARADAAQARANVRELQGVNQRTAEAFSRYRADAERLSAALVRQATRGAVNASELSTLTTEARNAPDDRPVGPVLDLYYQRLFSLDGPRTGSSGNPAGSGPPP